MMKDNISTGIVLEQALQLGYRYPLDVRSCKSSAADVSRGTLQQLPTTQRHAGGKLSQREEGGGRKRKKGNATIEKNRHGSLERRSQK